MIYNYKNLTYRFTGGSVINDPDDTKQEGVLIHLRRVTDDGELLIFMDKRDIAHLVKLATVGRKYWKRFRLPKMGANKNEAKRN